MESPSMLAPTTSVASSTPSMPFMYTPSLEAMSENINLPLSMTFPPIEIQNPEMPSAYDSFNKSLSSPEKYEAPKNPVIKQEEPIQYKSKNTVPKTKKKHSLQKKTAQKKKDSNRNDDRRDDNRSRDRNNSSGMFIYSC